MKWEVDLLDDFVPEFTNLSQEVQDELLACIELLEQFGPGLGRPHADTLNGSHYSNLKELRFYAAGGAWRFVFAFDPTRKGLIICGGDKSGLSEKRFYRELLSKADARYGAHIAALRKRRKD